MLLPSVTLKPGSGAVHSHRKRRFAQRRDIYHFDRETMWFPCLHGIGRANSAISRIAIPDCDEDGLAALYLGLVDGIFLNTSVAGIVSNRLRI